MTIQKALVVDDSKVAHLTLKKLLVERGIQVDWAPSGEACIEYLQKQKPDIVFMDVMMPGMDGFETTGKIHKDPALIGPPVVMCSANATDEDREKAAANGAIDFLSKPYTSDDLGQVLTRTENYVKDRAAKAAAPAEPVAAQPAAASISMAQIEALVRKALDPAQIEAIARRAIDPAQIETIARRAIDPAQIEAIARRAIDPAQIETIARKAIDPEQIEAIARKALDPVQVSEIAQKAAEQMLAASQGALRATTVETTQEVARQITQQMIADAEPVAKEMAQSAAERAAQKVAEKAVEMARTTTQSVAREVAQETLKVLAKPFLEDTMGRLDQRLNDALANSSGIRDPGAFKADILREVETSLPNKVGQIVAQLLAQSAFQERVRQITQGPLQAIVNDLSNKQASELQQVRDVAIQAAERKARECAERAVEQQVANLPQPVPSSPSWVAWVGLGLAVVALVAGVIGIIR